MIDGRQLSLEVKGLHVIERQRNGGFVFYCLQLHPDFLPVVTSLCCGKRLMLSPALFSVNSFKFWMVF